MTSDVAPDAGVIDRPPVQVQQLDWISCGLPEYDGKIALLVDNVFDNADCKRLLDTAEAVGDWSAAPLHGYRPEAQAAVVNVDHRDSGRIILDDQNLADWVLEKLRPHISQLEIAPDPPHEYHTVQESDPKSTIRLFRVNERMRYLRYGPGQFFRTHFDGVYHTPDKVEASYFTMQIYLSGSEEGLKGGTTRFFSTRRDRDGRRMHMDVEPVAGRVIIFQGGLLLHSGEAVKQGIKITIKTELMYKRVPDAPV